MRKTLRFKVGDRVISKDLAKGKTGTIKEVGSRVGDYSVEFDEQVGGHTCCGYCKEGCGFWVNDHDLDPAPASKFRVGDKVNIISVGKIYTRYDGWFQTYARDLKSFYKDKTPPADNEVEYTIKALGKHEREDKMLYAIENYDGEIFLIGEQGLQLAQQAIYKFKVGDKVKAIAKCDKRDLIGYTGTVCSIKDYDSHTPIGVAFDNEFVFGHDCNGHCEDGHGRWCEAESLELISQFIEEFIPDTQFGTVIDVWHDTKQVPFEYCYVARDSDGMLFAYTECPKVDIGGNQFYSKVFKVLDRELFKDIKPMDEPKKIR